MHNRASLCDLLPHSGLMCLIETVESYDDREIMCSTKSHLETGNPLRSANSLSAVCGVEYAAQAMALHAALVSAKSAPPRLGFLAGLRNVAISTPRLDLAGTTLRIRASKLIADNDRSIYEFWLHLDDQPALAGRAAVIMTNDSSILVGMGAP